MKIEKPWGYEQIIEKNDFYMLKKLFMKSGHRCSLQYHNRKTETIYVLKGDLKICYGNETLEEKVFTDGETITLLPGNIHRMEAITDSIYLEASTPDLEDVVRLADDYERSAK